jgi:hypothetical protein
MTLETINIEREKKTSKLIKECKMFFAFSDEQFEASKTKLQKGEKYVSLGGGVYITSNNTQKWKDEIKKIDKWKSEEIKNNNLEEANILYELRNYECFYTGDIEDVKILFLNIYSTEQIMNVYNKYRQYED